MSGLSNESSLILGDGFTVRELEMEDYDKEYMELLRQSGPICNLSIGQFVIRLIDMHKNRNHRVCVVEDEFCRQIVATGTLLVEPKLTSTLGHIEDVIVDKEHRDQGLGKMLIEHLIQQARDKYCDKIRVVVDPRTMGFYKKQSFVRSDVSMEFNFM